MIRLAVDAMGSDRGSEVILAACQRFVQDFDADLTVYGSQADLAHLPQHPRLHGVITTQVMEMTDGALAVRRKKDSSMVRAIEDLKAKRVDGVVSCGSTGALLSSATLLLGTLEHVERPAILSVLPNTSKRGVVVLDIGANASNTAEQLHSFAVLGKAYAKGVLQREQPKIGLLNIGSEAKKGDDLRKQTYQLLAEDERLHFIGNVEGKEILKADVDVIVMDGFTGNVMLKTTEGVASFMMGNLKEQFMASWKTKIGALLSKKALKQVKDQLDPDQYGGALIIGLQGPVVKGHGSSDVLACYNAIRQLYRVIEAQVVEKVKEELNA